MRRLYLALLMLLVLGTATSCGKKKSALSPLTESLNDYQYTLKSEAVDTAEKTILAKAVLDIAEEIQTANADPTPRQFLAVCPPYQRRGARYGQTSIIQGQTYTDAVRITDADGYLDFNLRGQYKTLAFDIGHIDECRKYDTAASIICDGETALTIPLHGDMRLEHYEVDLSGVERLRIRGNGYNIDDYAFVNLSVVSSGRPATPARTMEPGFKSLMSECPPYQSKAAHTGETVSMLGDTYVNVMRITDNGGYMDFILDGNYTELCLDVGPIDGEASRESALSITCDGEPALVVTLAPGMYVEHYVVPLAGVRQMSIRANAYYSDDYALVNVGIKPAE